MKYSFDINVDTNTSFSINYGVIVTMGVWFVIWFIWGLIGYQPHIEIEFVLFLLFISIMFYGVEINTHNLLFIIKTKGKCLD